MLTAYPPVLDMHGGGVRMYHNIRILSTRHRVRVISFVESEEERERLDSVREVCESVTAVQREPNCLQPWLSTQPFLIREFGTPEMHAAVDAAFRAERVDVLQCEYLQMAQFHRPDTFSVFTAIEAVSKNAWEYFQALAPSYRKPSTNWVMSAKQEKTRLKRLNQLISESATGTNQWKDNKYKK